MARKIEKVEFHNSREKQHNAWIRQAAEALEVDVDDDLLLGKTTFSPSSNNLLHAKIHKTDHAIYVLR